MAVTIQDNFNLAAAKAVDNRYAKISAGGVSTPYVDTTEAINAIPQIYRHRGLTVCVADGTSIKEYWWKDGVTNPDLVVKSGAVGGAKNGLTLDSGDGKIKLGGALTENTIITLGVPFNTNSLNLFISPVSTATSPYPDPTQRETQKGVFSCFSPSKFYNNVSIGGLGVTDRYNTPTTINNNPLYVYRGGGIPSSPICVTTYNLYEIAGSSISDFSGTCTTVAGAFNQFEWAASIDINLQNISGSDKSGATFSGNKSYFVYNSLYNTTGGNISASSAQAVFRARRILYANVTSSGNTLTIPGASPAADQVSAGDSIVIEGSTLLAASTRVLAVSGSNITMEYYNGTSWVPFIPSTPLSGQTIIIGRKGTLSAAGANSIDKVINYRSMVPVPDQQLGYRGTVGTVIGLQIDNLRTGIGASYNPVTQKPVGTLNNSYGILQLGELDKNYLAGPLIIPKAGSTSAGNKSMGFAQLVNGSVTINTTAARANNSMVFVCHMWPSGVPSGPTGTPGFLYVRNTEILDGSFTIKSTSATDNSFVNWWVTANSQY